MAHSGWLLRREDDALALLHAERSEPRRHRLGPELHVAEARPREAVVGHSLEGERRDRAARPSRRPATRASRGPRAAFVSFFSLPVHLRQDPLLHRRHVDVHHPVAPSRASRAPTAASPGPRRRGARRRRACSSSRTGRWRRVVNGSKSAWISAIFSSRFARRPRAPSRPGRARAPSSSRATRSRASRSRSRASPSASKRRRVDERRLEPRLQRVEERVARRPCAGSACACRGPTSSPKRCAVHGFTSLAPSW